MSAVKQEARSAHGTLLGRAAGSTVSWRRVGLFITLAVSFFLLGATPMGLKARESVGQRDTAQRELRLSQMQNILSSAVIDARRGEYEPARQTASDFFTTLCDQVEMDDGSALTQTQLENLRPLLIKRDEIVTLLARSDPASADRLADMYVSYRQAMSNVRPRGWR